jgi:Tol biopolymer transport system component
MNRLYMLMFVAFLTGVLVSSCMPSDGGGLEPLPAPTPRPRELAFVTRENGVANIYSVYPDGTQLHHLASAGSSSGCFFSIAWSPDHTQLAYTYLTHFEICHEGSLLLGLTGSEEIFVVNADGSGLIKVADGAFPSWDSNGERIAFLCDSGICIINADGSELTQLTGGKRYPVWCTNGTKIAFQCLRNGKLGICIIEPDGSNEIWLTEGTSPKWSPDCSQIAFLSGPHLKEDIYVINADGSGLINLSNSSKGNRYPVWSPDGKKVAFTGERDENSYYGDEVFVVNVDGSNLINLSNSPFVDFGPAWSPNGTYIAFTSNRTGNFEVFVVRADGAFLQNITNNPGSDELCGWDKNPDSVLLAFTSTRKGSGRSLYITNAMGGGETRNVTPSFSGVVCHDW